MEILSKIKRAEEMCSSLTRNCDNLIKKWKQSVVGKLAETGSTYSINKPNRSKEKCSVTWSVAPSASYCCSFAFKVFAISKVFVYLFKQNRRFISIIKPKLGVKVVTEVVTDPNVVCKKRRPLESLADYPVLIRVLLRRRWDTWPYCSTN